MLRFESCKSSRMFHGDRRYESKARDNLKSRTLRQAGSSGKGDQRRLQKATHSWHSPCISLSPFRNPFVYLRILSQHITDHVPLPRIHITAQSTLLKPSYIFINHISIHCKSYVETFSLLYPFPPFPRPVLISSGILFHHNSQSEHKPYKHLHLYIPILFE